MLEHLTERGMDFSLYPGAGYDDECATFPVRNFSGKITGVLKYRPDGSKKVQNDEKGKYYTYITKGEIGVFGLESLDRAGPIFLTGGAFKAATLHRLGFAALHVSSISPRILRRQLALLGRKYYALGDNDDEGAQFVRRFGGQQTPRDVDEMTDEEVLEMVSKYL